MSARTDDPCPHRYYPRKPVEVTADRLAEHTSELDLTGEERDDFARVIHVLHESADGHR